MRSLQNDIFTSRMASLRSMNTGHYVLLLIFVQRSRETALLDSCGDRAPFSRGRKQVCGSTSVTGKDGNITDDALPLKRKHDTT